MVRPRRLVVAGRLACGSVRLKWSRTATKAAGPIMPHRRAHVLPAAAVHAVRISIIVPGVDKGHWTAGAALTATRAASRAAARGTAARAAAAAIAVATTAAAAKPATVGAARADAATFAHASISPSFTRLWRGRAAAAAASAPTEGAPA